MMGRPTWRWKHTEKLVFWGKWTGGRIHLFYKVIRDSLLMFGKRESPFLHSKSEQLPCSTWPSFWTNERERGPPLPHVGAPRSHLWVDEVLPLLYSGIASTREPCQAGLKQGVSHEILHIKLQEFVRMVVIWQNREIHDSLCLQWATKASETVPVRLIHYSRAWGRSDWHVKPGLSAVLGCHSQSDTSAHGNGAAPCLPSPHTHAHKCT